METNFGSIPLEHVKVCLNEARKKAEVGDEPGARNYLSSVDYNRLLGAVQFSAEMLQEIKDVRKLTNRNAFDKNLAKAEELAARGEIGLMQGALAEARNNARLAEMAITPEQEKRFEEISRHTHLNAITARLQDAKEEAMLGHVAQVEGCIRVIHHCVNVVGIPLSKQVEDQLTQILKSARQVCITNNLSDALICASRREFDKAYGLLTLAGWHARQGGLRLNEHQEAKYISVLQLLIRGDYCIS